MAIEICASPSSKILSNTSLTTALSHTVIGGINRILIAFWNEANATDPSAYYNGTSMSLLFSQAGQLAGWYLNCYYMLEADLPVAGAYDVAFAGTGRGFGQVGAISMSGVSQVAADMIYDGNNTGNGQTVATETLAGVVNSALGLLWGASNHALSATWAPTSPAVEWADNTQTGTPTSSAGGVYQYATAGGNLTMTTTCSGSGFITAGAVALKPAEDVLGGALWF
jgi:hypothetical protein